MPESLFAPKPWPKGRLFAMVLGSLLVHAGIVGVAALRPIPNSYVIPPEITELDVDTQLGDTVQELIVPDMPSPPPEATPEPTPPPPPMPEETPPPPEPTPPPEPETEMPEEPKPTPRPTPRPTPPPPKKEKPKPVVAKPAPVPAGTPAPANAKKGPVPQAGVIGGVTQATKTVGTPGGSKIGSSGWKTPKPPYPYQARASRVQGSGSVRVSTDGSGRVISATISQSVGNAILDNNTVGFARSNWRGPPNSTTTVPITYRLQ